VAVLSRAVEVTSAGHNSDLDPIEKFAILDSYTAMMWC
jgi:hypothetical protein